MPTQTDSPVPVASDTAALRGQLAAHRAQQIARLEAYAKAGEFPHNYKTTDAHIFRDAAGRLCAVANLVHQDSRDDLVEVTVRAHNDLAIGDVKDGPMLEWVVASGLTQEELARIQMPVMPLAREPKRLPRPDLVAAKDELKMQAAVRQHIETVERELRANTATSLDIATARFVEHRRAEPLSG